MHCIVYGVSVIVLLLGYWAFFKNGKEVSGSYDLKAIEEEPRNRSEVLNEAPLLNKYKSALFCCSIFTLYI